MNCNSNTGRFPYAPSPQATPRMVDSASGELKTCFGNSVESFCVRRNTPPFGSSMSSPKRILPASSCRPARKVLFTVSPMRYLPAGRISFSIFGGGFLTLASSSFGEGFSLFSASLYSRQTRSLFPLSTRAYCCSLITPVLISWFFQPLSGSNFSSSPNPPPLQKSFWSSELVCLDRRSILTQKKNGPP